MLGKETTAANALRQEEAWNSSRSRTWPIVAGAKGGKIIQNLALMRELTLSF